MGNRGSLPLRYLTAEDFNQQYNQQENTVQWKSLPEMVKELAAELDRIPAAEQLAKAEQANARELATRVTNQCNYIVELRNKIDVLSRDLKAMQAARNLHADDATNLRRRYTEQTDLVIKLKEEIELLRETITGMPRPSFLRW